MGDEVEQRIKARFKNLPCLIGKWMDWDSV